MGETIGYIGLGVMGLPFARHLKAAGHDVVVYDRDAAARARAAEAGLRVAALSDATGSPGTCHAAGLCRMRDAGVTITTVKGIYYEWVRDLGTLARIKPLIGPDLPDGLTL